MYTGRLLRAIQFATLKHHTQLRKFTNTPYITHPLGVAEIVSKYNDSIDVQIAAVLHDILEDTDTKPEQIKEMFGSEVLNMVIGLTEPVCSNRKLRKKKYAYKLKQQEPNTQTIKLADIMHNLSTFDIMYSETPEFAKLYLQEKKNEIKSLTLGNQSLYNELNETIQRLENKYEIIK